MARSVLFEIDLARANAKLPAGAISAVAAEVRELLADFRLGERLRFDLAVNQATLVMSVSLAGSGQMGLAAFSLEAVDTPEGEAQREAHSLVRVMRERVGLLEGACREFRVTRYEVGVAAESYRSQKTLKILCAREVDGSAQRVAIHYPGSVSQEFRLSPFPHRQLVEEPIDLAFLIQSVAVSTASIRLAATSDAGRSLRKRRATLYWDGRSFPDLSARLFQTMHAGLTVTMTVREVSRPSGTVDQYLVLDTRLPVLAGSACAISSGVDYP